MASREILSLDTATPQIVAPQTGDTYSAPRAVAISPESLTGSAATTSLDIAQTWNTTGTPTAVKLNVTDTASNANSLLMDLGTGGGTFASKFSVRKDGRVLVSSILDFAGFFGGNSNYLFVASSGLVSFSGLTNAGTSLREDNAQNTLAQRNATNAQTFNVYNTYTNSTNYERGFLKWNTNVLQIGTEKGSGGGTARALEFQTDGTTRLTIASGGGVTVQAGFALTCEYLYGPSTRLVLGNNANQLVTIGGFTSSFPAIKRSSATLQARLADDSDYAIIDCSQIGTTKAYTVATLPAAGTAGRRAYVTDATIPTFLGALTGGGAVVCPVFDNGTAWVAG